ncbi:hypothetical protein [Occultella kanbiaonis]|uniref:hypothetical protein n=1 Tax=Occultella kanbiaonis TaxID=2675754 RepID=UPI0012B7FA3B|nr:hypothetical protein [Occultella kanbiaonis]
MTTPWTDVPSADSFDEAPEADVGGGARPAVTVDIQDGSAKSIGSTTQADPLVVRGQVALPILSVRELIAQLARTEDQIRLTGRFDAGSASSPDDLRQLLRQQDQLIAELRRRRAPCPREDSPVEDT